jgi:hypothetical protein
MGSGKPKSGRAFFLREAIGYFEFLLEIQNANKQNPVNPV